MLQTRMLRNSLLPIVAGAITSAIAVAAAAQATQPDRGDFDAAVAMLRDVAVRMDAEGLALARSRFEPFLDDESLAADAHYRMALADGASLFAPDMRARLSPEELEQRLDRAEESCLEAISINPRHVEALCLLAFVEKAQSFFAADEEARQARFESSAARLEVAREMAGQDRPVIDAAVAMSSLVGPQTDMQEGMKLLEKAIVQYDEHASGDRAYDAGWWPMIVRGMHARMLMLNGESREALERFNETLAIEPDFPMLTQVKPQLESMIAAEGDGYLPIAAGRIPDLRWTTLSEDTAGDGNNESLADGKAFSCAIDSGAEMVWFRFDLHNGANPEAFGVNVIVDADADQETGTGWWGTNRNFTWDRIVTVWVAKKNNGRYTGTVGVGDVAGLNRTDFANLHRGGVDFAVLEDAQAIVIGVPVAYLSDGDSINVIGAVGANNAWNDDLQDDGFATIELR